MWYAKYCSCRAVGFTTFILRACSKSGMHGMWLSNSGGSHLIVPASVIKNGTKEAEVEQAVQDAFTENQAENRGDKEHTSLEESGIEVTSGNQEVLVNDGGAWEEHDNSEPEDETSGKLQHRGKLTKNDTNSLETCVSNNVCVCCMIPLWKLKWILQELNQM